MQDRQESDRHLIDGMVERVAERIECDIPMVIVTEGDYEEKIGLSPRFIPNLPREIYEEFAGVEADGDVVRCIIIPPEFFYYWHEVDEHDIEVVIRHEYGHHLTWGEVTERDLRDENFKCMIMEIVLNTVYDPWDDGDIIRAEMLYFHHRLRSERIASEAGGVSIHDVHEAQYHQSGIRAANDIKYVDVHALVHKNMPIDILDIRPEYIYSIVMAFVTDDIISDHLFDDMWFYAKFDERLRIWISSVQR